MQRSLKSGLLSLLGASAILGSSLFLEGCKKEERDTSQVSQSIWDKLDGKKADNEEALNPKKKLSPKTNSFPIDLTKCKSIDLWASKNSQEIATNISSRYNLFFITGESSSQRINYSNPSHNFDFNFMFSVSCSTPSGEKIDSNSEYKYFFIFSSPVENIHFHQDRFLKDLPEKKITSTTADNTVIDYLQKNSLQGHRFIFGKSTQCSANSESIYAYMGKSTGAHKRFHPSIGFTIPKETIEEGLSLALISTIKNPDSSIESFCFVNFLYLPYIYERETVETWGNTLRNTSFNIDELRLSKSVVGRNQHGLMELVSNEDYTKTCVRNPSNGVIYLNPSKNNDSLSFKRGKDSPYCIYTEDNREFIFQDYSKNEN